VNELSEPQFLKPTKKYPINYLLCTWPSGPGGFKPFSYSGFFQAKLLVRADGNIKILIYDVKIRALMPLTDAARVLILIPPPRHKMPIKTNVMADFTDGGHYITEAIRRKRFG